MYSQHYSTRTTPQSEPIPGKTMVENNAGGFVFEVDDWTRLDRFLILGTEGGTYYTSERKLTIDACESVRRCIAAGGERTVARIVEISLAGRAPKNNAALFALAMCISLGDDTTRKAAGLALPSVARIGTHLFTFCKYVKALRGWGRGLRRAVAGWYESKDADALAYQVAKYRQRGGWSHRDVLRVAHPKPDETKADLYRYITHGDKAEGLIAAFEDLQATKSPRKAAALLRENPSLSWEMVPTEHLGSPEVWDALLPNLPMTALIRNLGRMSANGTLTPMSAAAGIVTGKLGNAEAIQKARIHPIAVLSALFTYKQGHGMKGGLTWEPVGSIVDALDDAFYLAFGNVEPSNKRTLIALDVSGSMGFYAIDGLGITARDAAAAMCMVVAKTEPNYHVTTFSHQMVPVSITAKQRLDDVIHTTSQIPYGPTDCAQPMLWALANNVEVDTFIIYTDNETWFGGVHPVQALQQYRQTTGIPAKLIVAGMTATGFSIADPSDAGMLDVVGFDSAAPSLMADFARN